jgi:hypothetical protein
MNMRNKESTKKDRYRSVLGGIQDRFDLIIPPGNNTQNINGLNGIITYMGP